MALTLLRFAPSHSRGFLPSALTKKRRLLANSLSGVSSGWYGPESFPAWTAAMDFRKRASPSGMEHLGGFAAQSSWRLRTCSVEREAGTGLAFLGKTPWESEVTPKMRKPSRSVGRSVSSCPRSRTSSSKSA